jgi:hypothetical protein
MTSTGSCPTSLAGSAAGRAPARRDEVPAAKRVGDLGRQLRHAGEGSALIRRPRRRHGSRCRAPAHPATASRPRDRSTPLHRRRGASVIFAVMRRFCDPIDRAHRRSDPAIGAEGDDHRPRPACSPTRDQVTVEDAGSASRTASKGPRFGFPPGCGPRLRRRRDMRDGLDRAALASLERRHRPADREVSQPRCSASGRFTDRPRRSGRAWRRRQRP